MSRIDYSVRHLKIPNERSKNKMLIMFIQIRKNTQPIKNNQARLSEVLFDGNYNKNSFHSKIFN